MTSKGTSTEKHRQAACGRTGDRAHAGPETVNGRPTALHGSERTRILGQKQQAVWKEFGNTIFGPASNLAVVHEIILGGVPIHIRKFQSFHTKHKIQHKQTSWTPRPARGCGYLRRGSPGAGEGEGHSDIQIMFISGSYPVTMLSPVPPLEGAGVRRHASNGADVEMEDFPDGHI